jgi:hypothetical protein
MSGDRLRRWSTLALFAAIVAGSTNAIADDEPSDVLFLRNSVLPLSEIADQVDHFLIAPRIEVLYRDVLAQADGVATEENEAEKAKAAADEAKAAAEKVHASAKAEAQKARALAEKAKEAAQRATIRGSIRISSPDGKTFEVVTPDEKGGERRVIELKEQRLPLQNRQLTIIRSADGEETRLEADNVEALVGKLATRVREGVELPKFVIGVSVSEAPPVVLAQLGKAETAAVVVDSVIEDSPAAKAGVQKYDLILKAGDESLRSPADLTKAVKDSDGKAITLQVIRGGKDVTVEVTPKSNEPTKVKPHDGVITFGPGMVMNRLQFPHEAAFVSGPVMEEIKAMRQDLEELKKMVSELKDK